MTSRLIVAALVSSLEASPETCETFHHFFVDKVHESTYPTIFTCPVDQYLLLCCFPSFHSQKTLLADMKSSGSPMDALPPHLFKEVFPSVGSSILDIVHSSFTSHVVPATLNMLVYNH